MNEKIEWLLSFRYYPLRWIQRVLDIPRDMRHLYQRATRGWSDRDTYNFDEHLARVIAGGVRHIKGHTRGVSFAFSAGGDLDVTMKAWRAVLQEIAEGFEATEKLYDTSDSIEIQRLQQKQAEALTLFAKHFNCLWQ